MDKCIPLHKELAMNLPGAKKEATGTAPKLKNVLPKENCNVNHTSKTGMNKK